MTTKPLLSVCIATYNRARYIGETLDSILPQLTSEVEVVVADGASTDSTGQVVCQYANRDPRVRYIRLQKKGGVDHDYDKAVEFASGQYCWLFTDDDVLNPGAIEAVVRMLRRGFGLIIVNAEVRDRSLRSVIQSQRVPLLKDKVYPPEQHESLFVELLDYLSFIGAVVIRRSVWMSRNRRQYFGTEFVHVGVIFQAPLSFPVALISKPYVAIRLDNAQWEPRRFEIWMFKWPKLIWSFPDFSDNAKLKVIAREPWLNFRNLVANRDLGAYNLNLYYRYLHKTHVGVAWKFFAVVVACAPRKLIRIMRYFYRVLKHAKNRND